MILKGFVIVLCVLCVFSSRMYVECVYLVEMNVCVLD